MDATGNIREVTYVRTRHDFYVVAVDNEKIGTLRGNYATGFWAYRNGELQIPGTFQFPGEAAEVLALEVEFDQTASEVPAPPVRRLA